MNHQRNIHFQIWAPFGFCAIILFMALHAGSSDLRFFCIWLPICFFGVARAQLSLLNRIKALESALQGRSSEMSPATMPVKE